MPRVDFGVQEFGIVDSQKRLAHYRKFVYEKGCLILQEEARMRGIELTTVERSRYCARYFTDSSIIGTKDFVEQLYRQFQDHFSSKHEKRPKGIKRLEGIFSLKQLSEAI